MGGSRRITWLVFIVGVVAVVDVLGWVTWQVLRLERAQGEARAEAIRQEAIGRALWRMDSIVLPLLAVEGARPYFDYQAFYAANRGLDEMWAPAREGDVLVASPLLGEAGDFVLLHFERDGAMRLSSPQAPQEGAAREAAVRAGVPETLLAMADIRLYELDRLQGGGGVLLGQRADDAARRLALDGTAGGELGAGLVDGSGRESAGPEERDAGNEALSGPVGPVGGGAARSAPEQAPGAAEPSVTANAAAPAAPGEARAELAQDFAARQQAVENVQSYSDAGRSNRARTLEPRAEGGGSAAEAERAAGAEVPAAEDAALLRTRESATSSINVLRVEEGTADAPAGLHLTLSTEPLLETALIDEQSSRLVEMSPGFWGASGPMNGRGVSGRGPEAGSLVPLWIGGGSSQAALVLVREVRVGGEVREQGVWIDWGALRRALESSVSDLFPLAEVRPLVEAGAGGVSVERLATIPAVLVPGPLGEGIVPATSAGWSPTRWTLLVGWLAVAAAVVAIGVVLRKAIELGERRGRFVSAVTHELRTPLTTFRLYSQMLAGGQVVDEAKRQRYAQTLDRESQRLSGIVESVLEYARLGRRRGGVGRAGGAGLSRMECGALLERVMPTLAGRAERGGMTLGGPEEAPACAVEVDADKVERILLNLVDNACKYAGESADRRIELGARVEGEGRERRLVLGVRDHGPGVAPGERGRIFRAFHRAKHHDASASPGLGLGLAIARGLAREMGGELRLAEVAGPGAAFEVVLPVV